MVPVERSSFDQNIVTWTMGLGQEGPRIAWPDTFP